MGILIKERASTESGALTQKGIVHKHEAIEDSVRIETKIFPNGGAIAAWNKLVGLPD